MLRHDALKERQPMAIVLRLRAATPTCFSYANAAGQRPLDAATRKRIEMHAKPRGIHNWMHSANLGAKR